MKKMIIATLLGLSSFGTISVVAHADEARSYEEQKNAERKARQDRRIECIRNATSTTRCPEAY